VRVERDYFLRKVTDPVPFLENRWIAPEKANRPPCRFVQTEKDLDQGGLTRAVRTHETKVITLVERERRIRQNLGRVVPKEEFIGRHNFY
jgi:hypothetical protein